MYWKLRQRYAIRYPSDNTNGTSTLLNIILYTFDRQYNLKNVVPLTLLQDLLIFHSRFNRDINILSLIIYRCTSVTIPHKQRVTRYTSTLLNTHSPPIPYPYSRPVINLIISLSLRFSSTARRPMTALRPLQLGIRLFTPFKHYCLARLAIASERTSSYPTKCMRTK